MVISANYLTIQEFFDLPEGDRPSELVDGQAILKLKRLKIRKIDKSDR